MAGFTVEQYITDDAQFSSRDEAVELLRQTATKFGGIHLAYGILNPGKQSPRLAFDAISTYSDEWLTRYFTQGYYILDPILQTARTARGPFDWNAARYQSKPIKSFFGESIEHGLGKQGFAVPIRGPNGEVSIFSFNADVNDNNWSKMRDEILPHFLLFAFQFNERAMNVRRPKISGPMLSSRESEVLKWAAEGKSVWETAQILGISDHSVKAYLQNGQRKLKCCNKLHTVVTAVRLGII